MEINLPEMFASCSGQFVNQYYNVWKYCNVTHKRTPGLTAKLVNFLAKSAVMRARISEIKKNQFFIFNHNMADYLL